MEEKGDTSTTTARSGEWSTPSGELDLLFSDLSLPLPHTATATPPPLVCSCVEGRKENFVIVSSYYYFLITSQCNNRFSVHQSVLIALLSLSLSRDRPSLKSPSFLLGFESACSVSLNSEREREGERSNRSKP